MLGVRVRGDVDLSGTEVVGNLLLESASVGGSVLCRSAAEPSGAFTCEITGKAWLLNAEVRSSVEFGGALIRGDLCLDGARISNHVLMYTSGGARTTIAGSVHFNNATVSRAVQLKGLVVVGRLNIEGTSIGDSFAIILDLQEGPRRNLVRPEIRGGIRARSIVITRDVTLTGAFVGAFDDHAEAGPAPRPP